jgi:acyl carrier protein
MRSVCEGEKMNALEKIRSLIIQKFGISPGDFTDDDSFVTIGVTSMQMINFIADIEELFAFAFDFEKLDFTEIESPRKLAQFIEKHHVRR